MISFIFTMFTVIIWSILGIFYYITKMCEVEFDPQKHYTDRQIKGFHILVLICGPIIWILYIGRFVYFSIDNKLNNYLK
jgi:uncharacterized protein with PQ loop repeat